MPLSITTPSLMESCGVQLNIVCRLLVTGPSTGDTAVSIRTLSIMPVIVRTLSIISHSIRTLCIIVLSIRTLGIILLSVRTLSIMPIRIRTQRNDT
jgi:hypothetical protein